MAYAIAGNRTELVHYLIEQKIDLNSGRTVAVCEVGSPLQELLLSAGADINATFTLPDSTTPVDYLFSAAADGDLAAVNYFLSKGIDPNRSPAASPLIMAISKAQPDIVKVLLAAKANSAAIVLNPATYGLQGATNKKCAICSQGTGGQVL